MPKIVNINNDNARNLRWLVPKIAQIARDDDYIALIEQDVLMFKDNWVGSCLSHLTRNTLVSASGAYTGEIANNRRGKPKPYFSVYKASDSEEIHRSIRTNRGSFVTLNIAAENCILLDKHRRLAIKSHAFGTDDRFWAVHARGGSNHNGEAEASIKYFSDRIPKRFHKRINKTW
jgi:hypothetical protein